MSSIDLAVPVEERLKTIKRYHMNREADRLSLPFVEKAIDDALARIKELEGFEPSGFNGLTVNELNQLAGKEDK